MARDGTAESGKGKILEEILSYLETQEDFSVMEYIFEGLPSHNFIR